MDPLGISDKTIEELAEFSKKADEEAKAVQLQLDELMKKKQNLASKIVHVKILKGGDGYIQRDELKTHISVFVKVFHGERKNHEFKVSILDRIYTIYERLFTLDKVAMKQYFEMRLIYPMGYLRRLDPFVNDTFLDQ